MVRQNRFKPRNEDTFFPLKNTFQTKGKLYCLEEPWVMGIINCTPDSFYKSSRVSGNNREVLEKAVLMAKQGVRIIDIGGYSSRPNADYISEEEELNRVVSVIESVRRELPEVLISVDTFRHQVAKEAVSAGADLVNDISGGELDEEMIETVGTLGVPYICMHMRGNPNTMQHLTEYEDIEAEIMGYFSKKLEDCKKAGIKDVILDLGFGFAKTMEQNYRLVRSLDYFNTLPCLLLAGISRKSMVYKLLECSPEEALNGTTALNMALLMEGAQLLRVHDVKEAIETIKIYKQLYI
jgi:dihydropteroate synthase